MSSLLRLLAATLPIFLFPGAAAAQVEVAPPPRPGLDQVVREYLRLGLPLPPKDAELVRIGLWRRIEENSNQRERFYWLGFRLPPARPGADPRCLVGSGFEGPEWIDPRDLERAEPTPVCIADVEMSGIDYLHLSIFCKLRGWNELASALSARMWKDWGQIDVPGEEPFDLFAMLRADAFLMWEGQLSERTSDRKFIIARLKELLAEDARLRNPKQFGRDAPALIKQLEATINHKREAKPGSAESLIDDLTDHWRDPKGVSQEGQVAYLKLTEMGFDAVPALIEHLSDDRLTRETPGMIFTSTGGVFRWNITVGHLCSRILSDLSAGKLDCTTGGRVERKLAREWFDEVKKQGEEKWLLDHADKHAALRLLGSKYPSRLVVIYREALKQPVASRSLNFSRAISASSLTREQKVSLLEAGAAHENVSWQLEAIAELEGKTATKWLLAALKQIEQRQRNESNYLWEPAGDIWDLASLVIRSKDRECWETLIRVTRLLPWQLRMEMVDAIGYVHDLESADAARADRLRFLLRFMDDRTKHKADPGMNIELDQVEVRDYAATRLAGLLRLPIARHPMMTNVMHSSETGPLSRLILRAAVQQKSQTELARMKK